MEKVIERNKSRILVRSCYIVASHYDIINLAHTLQHFLTGLSMLALSFLFPSHHSFSLSVFDACLFVSFSQLKNKSHLHSQQVIT